MKPKFIGAEGRHRFVMVAGLASQGALALALASIGAMGLLVGHQAHAQDTQSQDRVLTDFSELLELRGWHQDTDAEGNIILYRTRQPAPRPESPRPESPGSKSVQVPAKPAGGIRQIELLRLIGRLRSQGWRVAEDGAGGLLLTPPHSDGSVASRRPQTRTLPDKDADGVTDEVDLCPDTDAERTVGPLGCPAGQPVELEKVHFYSSSSRLRVGARKELDRVAAILRRQPHAEVTVLGHTDSVGGAEANMKLSLRRAKAVREYLVGQGVEAQRVAAEGRGESQPIADNSTQQGRLKNRRVELLIRSLDRR